MALPKFMTKIQEFALLQTQWTSKLDPLINFAPNSGNIITNVILSSSTVVNHGLGRPYQGWTIIRLSGNATVYENAAGNTNPSQQLLLISSSGVPCNLHVF